MKNSITFEGADFLLNGDELTDAFRDALLDCGRSGAADAAVEYVRHNFTITGNEADCRKYLKGFGAWDAVELANHELNLDRLVWLAGCDLRESGEIYFSAY
jgi:hypothetical protein